MNRCWYFFKVKALSVTFRPLKTILLGGLNGAKILQGVYLRCGLVIILIFGEVRTSEMLNSDLLKKLSSFGEFDIEFLVFVGKVCVS